VESKITVCGFSLPY